MLENKNNDQDFVILLSDKSFQTFGREACDESADQNRNETDAVEHVVPDVDWLNHFAQVAPRDIRVHPLCDKYDEQVD